MHVILFYFSVYHLQEPEERKLGETTTLVSKNSRSYIKTKDDFVYDVPLLRSLHQQLCDEHIFKEVDTNDLSTCMHM